MIKRETVELLDSKIADFFPKEGNWKSNCFRREEVVSESNLPCHLRDIDWLASLIMKKYNLFSLGEGVVREYVRDSKYFNELRSQYEARIVKWQINWMLNDGENWIVDPKYGSPDFFMFSPMCDYGFRKGIVDTLLAIGMDINAIEEGIEKNTDMWLESYMNLAFNNQFNPIFPRYRITSTEKETADKLPDVDPVFKDCWLKYRKYQYYQDHKESIEAYGTITPEMQMTDEEVADLLIYLQEQERARLVEIENFKTRKKDQKLPELKEMSQSDFYGLSYEDCLPEKQDNDGDTAKGLRKFFKGFSPKNDKKH